MASETVEIRRITVLGLGPEPLVSEAEREGHRFLRRLRDEWAAGTNRFDRPGELLLGAFSDGRLVGIGGLNQDPYEGSGTVGRLRHVYVLAEARRLGVGTLLVREIMSEAKALFPIVRLRTTTPGAAAFYAHLGFTEINDETATHFVRFHPGAA